MQDKGERGTIIQYGVSSSKKKLNGLKAQREIKTKRQKGDVMLK